MMSNDTYSRLAYAGLMGFVLSILPALAGTIYTAQPWPLYIPLSYLVLFLLGLVGLKEE